MDGYFNRVHALPPSAALLLNRLPVAALEDKTMTPSWSRCPADLWSTWIGKIKSLKFLCHGNTVAGNYKNNLDAALFLFPLYFMGTVPTAKVTRMRVAQFNLSTLHSWHSILLLGKFYRFVATIKSNHRREIREPSED